MNTNTDDSGALVGPSTEVTTVDTGFLKKLKAMAKRKRKATKRQKASNAGGWIATHNYMLRGPIEHPNRTTLTHDEIQERRRSK